MATLVKRPLPHLPYAHLAWSDLSAPAFAKAAHIKHLYGRQCTLEIVRATSPAHPHGYRVALIDGAYELVGDVAGSGLMALEVFAERLDIAELSGRVAHRKMLDAMKKNGGPSSSSAMAHPGCVATQAVA